MTIFHAVQSAATRIKRAAMLVLYPELDKIPPAGWSTALQRARSTSMDTLELTGVVAAVALVTWILGDVAPANERIALTAANVARFFLAIPLLALCAGPFLVRRTRRGLAQVRQEHYCANHSMHASQGGRP